MLTYDHLKLQKKWPNLWNSHEVYSAQDPTHSSLEIGKKNKKYILVEFPFPSGSSLHLGHMMRYTLPDVYARYLRMKGFNVLFPMGWDAFGLPAENAAIKLGKHPNEVIQTAIENYKQALNEAGFGFDWDREINTTDPSYYKWTQWIFLKFYEKGLAELKETPVLWCENLKTVLAYEEVVRDANGNLVAERDGKSPVEKRYLKQWILKITQYADKLLEGLNEVDYPESVKAAQINWIGRSEGVEIKFKVIIDQHQNDTEEHENYLTVFTTRIDTIYGATAITIAPEHPLLEKLTIINKQEIQEYAQKAKKKIDIERLYEAEHKTGFFTGSYAINPFNNKIIPIWVADYVLSSYGTGAIMVVPAHDQRDYQFAIQNNLEIIQVIQPFQENSNINLPYEDKQGFLINSGEFSGLSVEQATQAMIDFITKNNIGKKSVHYKLRDWVFSRQRYWGEPIPLIHRADGKIEAIASTEKPEEYNTVLPLKLPQIPNYQPDSDSISPLEKDKQWVNTVAKDGTPAKRETNTMPNWAGSCWYYLRYTDPHNNDFFADYDKLKYWLPVDVYFGGSEHTYLHLLYSRFWHKFLYDLGLVPTSEPYRKRINGGILLGPDGEKMSKSRGNVVNPDEKIQKYGSDALRIYINFMGPYDGTIIWQENGLKACRKLLDKIVKLSQKVKQQPSSQDLQSAYHKMLKNVTIMISNLKTNTAISQIMIFVDKALKSEFIGRNEWLGFIKVIAPFAPFLAEELWQEANNYAIEDFSKEKSVHTQPWPEYEENLAKDETIKIGVQIDGKLRGEVEITIDEKEESVKQKALQLHSVSKHLQGKSIKKIIYIQGKIINIVTDS